MYFFGIYFLELFAHIKLDLMASGFYLLFSVSLFPKGYKKSRNLSSLLGTSPFA
jgi:hypothetical protein